MTATAPLFDLKLVLDIVLPFAAVLVGAWVATLKFKKERLWTEKYAAYQKVLGSLDAITHWSSETVSDVFFLPGVGTDKFVEEYTLAQREILRQTTVGSLLLSEKFIEELELFQTEFFRERHSAHEDYEDDPQAMHIALGQHAGRVQQIVSRHLPVLISLARKDLGAQSWNTYRNTMLRLPIAIRRIFS
jgi:hypothetical protein